ncbi:MAG: LacI family DNA-binding transcriptional regulator [Undibacterium sp.]|nr:LacI family DNA-binding transcriptional regulator [Opitutaceae bacterium]
MKHVAQAAGVSVMTVSLALRRAPSIPAATRERVLAEAERLGYRRNPLVSALMAGLRGRNQGGREAHVLAYAESFPANATRQQTESLRRFRAGATACAARHGYRLELFPLGGSGLSEARLERVMEARGIRGVVFAPVPRPGTPMKQTWANHAVAALGFSIAAPALHRAVNHQIHSIRLALKSLLALGYLRIGLVISRAHDERVDHHWLSSVLLTQYEHRDTGASFPLLFEDRVRPQALAVWLKRERPEVVLTTEPQIAPLMRRARAADGSGFGFAHLDLTPDLRDCSGIDQNNERVGAAGVDLVVEQLHGNDFGLPENPKTVLIEGRWVPGATAPGPGAAGRRR